MKKQKQPPQKLTTQYGSFQSSLQTTLCIVTAVTLAVVVFVCINGSLVEPDFWEPSKLLARFKILLVIMFVNSLLYLVPLGCSFHIFLASVDAAVNLMQQAGNFLLIILTAVFIELRLAIVRYLPGKRIPEAALKNHVHAILTAIQQRLIAQRPKTKAPLFLYQQAPLLVAP